MNSLIETLNGWGEHALRFAWPMLWQSSLLIAVVFAFEFSLRRKVRAAVRYSLWLVVLVKLLLPPTLALPTGLAWWLRPAAPPLAKPRTTSYVVTYGPVATPVFAAQTAPAFVPPPPPQMSLAAWSLVTSNTISFGLLGWLLVRWRRVARDVRRATAPPEWLAELLMATGRQVGISRPIRLRLTDRPMSPAVCGLFRPVILLPRSIAAQLPPHRLRAVLLHELFHLRRGDVWINFAQTLLNIAYFWHSLLWLANARIRRLREEAVDDAVMLDLRDEAETYAPTLLEVAKLAFDRPLASLGLVEILESRNALRQRIERLLNFRAPQRAGLSLLSVLGILTFTALAVPMGETPAKREEPSPAPGSRNGRVENRGTQITTSNVLAWEIEALGSAGAVEYNFSNGLATASNGVVVRHGGVVLTADKVAVNQQTGEVIADGVVRIQGNGQYWSGEHIRYLDGRAATEKRIAAVQDAKLLFEMGKLDQAETKLKQVIKDDPGNNAAYFYLNLVTERGIHPIPLTSPEGRELPVPNPYARTNLIHTSEARQAIIRKLETIRLDRVFFDSLPLGEVVRSLNEETRKRDPEKKGINFIISTNVGAGVSATPGQVDPTTHLPAAPVEAVDMSAIAIKINPALMDVSLAELLDAIVKVADKPIKYSIENYAVVFSLKSHETSPLYVREFKVDPNTFKQGLESVVGVPFGNSSSGASGGGQQGNSPLTVPRVAPAATGAGGQGGGVNDVTRRTEMERVSAGLREFLSSLGVDLSPPKSVLYTHGEGTLVVRATLQDLDTIESAVQVLNIAPPQVNIKMKYIELPESEAKALREKFTPTNNPSWGSNLVILNEPAARLQLTKWQAIPEVNLLYEASITTLSGRQAQIQWDIAPPEALIDSPDDASAPGKAPKRPEFVAPQNQIPNGARVLDVLANVAADGNTIQMTLIPTITEFLGYDEPGSQAELPAQLNDTASQPRREPLPLPRFRLRQTIKTVIVRDGQTLALGLGDKLTGRLPGNESSPPEKKSLIIFVTPTIIDPAGNRVHSENEMPNRDGK